MKDAVNNSDVAKIRKMMEAGEENEQIAHALNLTLACVERNVKHLSKSRDELIKLKKNQERALKAAKTRALKKQAEEMAEKAAAAMVEEEKGD